MNDYYPAGVTSIPGDELCPCDKCEHKNSCDDYINCPECGDLNLCTRCNTCNSCNIKFDTCECGSEELVVEGDDFCKLCFDNFEE